MSPSDDNSGVEKSITNLKTKQHKEKNKSETKELSIKDDMIYMKKSDFIDFVSKALSDRLPPEIAKVVMAIIPEVIADVPKSSTR